MKTLYTLALVLLCNMMMYAQADYWQGGLFFGISNYSGDINPTASPDFSDSGMSIGVVGQAYVSSKLGFRGSLIYANLSGNDQNNQERSERCFKFNTNLVELSAVAEWEPFGSNRYYSDAKGKVVMDKLVSPYIFGGLAVGLASLNTDFSNYNGGNETIMNGIRQDRDVGNSTAFFALLIMN